jgi:hypothetical protein
MLHEAVDAKKRSQSKSQFAGPVRLARTTPVDVDEKVALNPGMAEHVHGGRSAGRAHCTLYEFREVIQVVTGHAQMESLQDGHGFLAP